MGVINVCLSSGCCSQEHRAPSGLAGSDVSLPLNSSGRHTCLLTNHFEPEKLGIRVSRFVPSYFSFLYGPHPLKRVLWVTVDPVPSTGVISPDSNNQQRKNIWREITSVLTKHPLTFSRLFPKKWEVIACTLPQRHLLSQVTCR